MCHACTDETKVLRRCPKPLRDPGAFVVPAGEPSCPVLDVDGWFWDAVRVGSLIERGSVTPSEITGRAWEFGEVAWGELEQARRAHEWAAQKRREWLERHGRRDG